jgi:ABC-type multidrug transport system ATPase subunit
MSEFRDEVMRSSASAVPRKPTKHDGVAVLLSSHLLERVQSVCDRVALFNAGRIVLIGKRAGVGDTGLHPPLSR